MDEQRFDHLSRQFAGFRTRRQALKAIAGAVVASVAGGRSTAAQSCTPPYGSCGSDDQCCAGSVCQYGLCMPGCRIDGAFQNAWTSPPGEVCRQCLPELSTTSWSPANEGMSCWSGDPNAGTTFCQAGVCAPAGPTGCPPPPACHTEELIDPATCTYANAEAGTPCGSGPICHGEYFQPADMCDGNGFCIGGGSRITSCAPYVCGDGACATGCETDGDCTAGTTCCDGSCVALGTIDHCAGCGDACTPADACTPVACTNGTCRQTSICSPVDTCTPAECLGNGSCKQVSACTGETVCESGTCVSICLELGDVCATPEQCCGVGQVCAPVTGASDIRCCLELGAAGCAESSDDCCAHMFPSGSGTAIACGNGVCGGPEARCADDVSCASGTCCRDSAFGVCCAADEQCVNDECVPICLELGDRCETAERCCGEGQTCAPVGGASNLECCLELGAAGCTGEGENCCLHVFPAGSVASIGCGNGVCGGPGARCSPGVSDDTCASGTCCGFDVDAVCCAADEQCVDFECVPV